MYKRYTAGFTIIELLVVIVVIAILVTIAIVGYSWVTKDARRTDTIATIQQYRKAVELQYIRKKTIYPVNTPSSSLAVYACLAKSVDLPAVNGYQKNQCVKRTDVHQIPYEETVQLLGEAGAGLKPLLYVNGEGGDHKRSPYIYLGSSKPFSINYVLEGQVNCHDDKPGYLNPYGQPYYKNSSCTINFNY